MRKIPVLMVGGRGERLWPLSRAGRPKQFAEIIKGEGSFFRKTVERISPLFSEIFVVTDQAYAELVQAEVCQPQLIFEPFGRNTAACIGLAAIWLEHLYPDETIVMVNLPSDHFISNPDMFRQTLTQAMEIASKAQNVVTLGIVPNRPETGYGYLKMSTEFAPGVYYVDAFVEKPDGERALAFLNDGHYLWNCGIYIWQVATVRALIARYLPGLDQALNRIKAVIGTPQYEAVLSQEYQALEAISIDYGIAERVLSTHSVDFFVLPCCFGWDDVGTWSALERIFPQDEEGNISVGKHIGLTTRDCTFFAPDKLLATLGVEHIVLVEHEGVIFLSTKTQLHQLKKLLEKMRQEGFTGYL